LLRLFLAHREDIVESIERVLNAQRKPVHYLQDRSLLSSHFEDCFFAHPAVTAGQTPLRGQLREAHGAAGFKPRQVHYVYNDLVDPAEMTIRAFHCWQQTRWPGRNGRMHYAQTLFNLHMVRYFAFLSIRVWDEEPHRAAARLAEIQRLLDELWRSSPAGQPAFVRDARWLNPLAQSLITDELLPYFEVDLLVAETFPPEDALEIRKAHVRMLGGHLTSQIRHYCTSDGVPLDDPSIVVRTRTSNALDFGLLIHGLVELLKAYDRALLTGGEPMRIEMAGAILQGISPDPELFLNRVDVLRAYSMVEPVFIAGRGDKPDEQGQHAAYTPLGARHDRLLKEYGALMQRLAPRLRDDAPRFRPVEGGCSPYGVMFGIPSNLIEHMALKALEHDAEARFSLEDVFDDRDASAAKLAWVNGWRNLPHIATEVQRLYEYPQQFAEKIFSRIECELNRHEAGGCAASATGRLYLESVPTPAAIPELPGRYIISSDKQIVAARKAAPYDRAQLLRERREGHFLVSYETPGGWVALKKELLSEVLAAGSDARIAGLPLEAVHVLQLMCAGLVTPEA